jgi:hypothetical protein
MAKDKYEIIIEKQDVREREPVACQPDEQPD